MTKFRTFALAAALGATLATIPATVDAQVRPGMGRDGRAQQQGERPLRFYLLGGYAQVELDELNARLAGLDEPYTPIGEDLFVFGGGIHGRMGRMIVGAEAALMGSLEDAEMGDERKAELAGFTGSLLLGFSIVQTYGFDFYPFVQAGMAAATLTVEERGDPSWNELLGDPGRQSMLTNGMLYGAAGVGMDYTFRNGFFLGARGSWGYTPAADNWSEQTGDVLGGPEMDLSGPSVRLLIGFGGRD